ncbi:hypothetical protein B9Z19DRAFT_1064790 [Tuber borchii]|uniref:Uncharacterized protein n=1 Tax=Tuber borchii TaxID=42251 RepID=A0A2T6ZTG7_TUBBO|nr:hypothetical protein B9Z19DRAFT_1064790 [Tuber borchii]
MYDNLWLLWMGVDNGVTNLVYDRRDSQKYQRVPSPSPYSLDLTKIPPLDLALSSTSSKGPTIPALNRSPPSRSTALRLTPLEFFPLPHSHNTPSPSDGVNTPLCYAGPSLPTKFRLVHLRLAQNRAETQQKWSDSEPESDDNADETGKAETSDKPHKPPQRPHPPGRVSTKLIPGATLGASPNITLLETYIDFNEYFGLHIRKDSIANTYEGLRLKRQAEIGDVPHTEPWAVSDNDGRLLIVFSPDVALV